MKKLIALLIVLMAIPSMAQDLSLRAKAGSPGYIDADTIDVASVGANEKIVVELVLSNLDFSLAGFEGAFLHPTFLSLTKTDDVGTADTPFVTGLPSAQKLPADTGGNDTATTFRNDRGEARVGVVITAPEQRPDAGEWVLAEFSFVLGRDYSSSLTARSLDTCTSAAEIIEFLACNTGAANCHIIADDTANPVTVNYAQADLQVALIDSGTTDYKGDANGSGTLTNQDVGPALQCIFFGDSSTNPNCSLDSTDTDKWNRVLDVNCDGSVTNQDVSPLLQRALGNYNRSANKRLDYMALDAAGKLTLPGGDDAANVVGVDLMIDGRVNFDNAISLGGEAIADGWQVTSKYIARDNVYRYLLFNTSGKDRPVPTVELSYESNGAAKVAIANVESYRVDSSTGRHAPRLNRNDLR